MACQIKRDNNGNIAEVLAPNNKPSILYSSLVDAVSDPAFKQNVLNDGYVSSILDTEYIKDTSNEELALAAWSKAYSADFIDSFGDWKNKNLPGTDFNGEPLLESLYTFGNQIIKPGVSKSQERLKVIQEVFNSNPELSKVGNVFSYAIYLDTVFPNSKVKDIVYHGTDIKREQLSSISNRLKTRLTILNEGFDGFGKRLGLFYQNQKIGEIVYRTKDYLEHKGYPVVNELHIGFEKKFQGKGYFQDALLEFLKYDNTPIYIAEGRVVNDNVFKAIDKLDRNKLDTFKLEDHGYIITLPVEYVYDRTGGEEGVYFTNLKERAEYYSDWRSGFNISGEVQGTGETPNYIVYPAVLNMENPSSGNEIKNKATISTKDRYKIKGDSLKYDVEVQSGKQEIEYVVFEPEQIHILSSKADIQGFKDFMSFENSEFSKYGTYQQFRDFITSKSSIEIENKLIETGKIDRAC